MKIKEYIKNLLERYSFHSIAWMFWILLFAVCIFIKSYSYLCPKDIYGQVLIWDFIFFGPTIIFPVITVFELLIFLFLLKKEKLKPDFRIKNNKLTTNPIYEFFILISNILGWVTILFFLIGSLAYVLPTLNIALNIIFIIITCPILIIMGLVYLVISKKFLP